MNFHFLVCRSASQIFQLPPNGESLTLENAWLFWHIPRYRHIHTIEATMKKRRATTPIVWNQTQSLPRMHNTMNVNPRGRGRQFVQLQLKSQVASIHSPEHNSSTNCVAVTDFLNFLRSFWSWEWNMTSAGLREPAKRKNFYNMNDGCSEQCQHQQRSGEDDSFQFLYDLFLFH